MPLGPKDLQDRVEHDFTLHPPHSQEIADQMDSIRDQFKELALHMTHALPPGREQSTCITHLEEGCFWAIGAIARNQ